MAPAPGLWEWIAGALYGFLAILVGLIYSRSEKQIKEDRLRIDAALAEVATKEELKAVKLEAADLVRHSDYDQNRSEIRQDIVGIHLKIDTMGRDLHSQISTTQSNLLTAIASLKSEKQDRSQS